MKYRETVMYVEIGCFVVCLLGWALVCSTLPTEYWNVSTLDQGVLTTSNFFSNLWKDCVSDSTGVSDCKEFPSLLALDLNIHMCRALVIMAIILSFFGAVLSLVGMKCTKIGGSDVASTRVTFAAGINNMVAGFCAMIAYSWYGNKIRKEFVNPNFKGAKFEIGAALFVGWGGSSLLIIGGFIFSFFAKKEGLRCRYADAHREPAAPAFSSWPKTHHFDSSVPFSPRTPVPFRSTLQLEPTSCTPARTRRTTIISLPLKEVSEGRKTRATTTLSRAPTDTYV